MNRILLASGVLGGLMVAIGVGGAGAKKDKEAGADGVWLVVGLEQMGKKLPTEVVEKLNMKLTIKGNKYTVMVADKVHDQGTSTVDATKKPNTVDIKSEEGENKGKTILAIVEIKGDSMKACYDMVGAGRPTEFATQEGSSHVLILYKREMKKKSE